jgi:hypothetical protein
MRNGKADYAVVADFGRLHGFSMRLAQVGVFVQGGNE